MRRWHWWPRSGRVPGGPHGEGTVSRCQTCPGQQGTGSPAQPSWPAAASGQDTSAAPRSLHPVPVAPAEKIFDISTSERKLQPKLLPSDLRLRLPLPLTLQPLHRVTGGAQCLRSPLTPSKAVTGAGSIQPHPLPGPCVWLRGCCSPRVPAPAPCAPEQPGGSETWGTADHEPCERGAALLP